MGWTLTGGFVGVGAGLGATGLGATGFGVTTVTGRMVVVITTALRAG